MTTLTIDVKELPSRLSEALDAVRAGSEVIVRDANGAVAKLVPPTPPPAQREWVLGLHPGAMVMREDFDAYISEADFLRGDF